MTTSRMIQRSIGACLSLIMLTFGSLAGAAANGGASKIVSEGESRAMHVDDTDGVSGQATDKNRVYNVAIVVWDGVELLDFAGPGEVFAAASNEQGPCFKVFTVSHSKEPITSQGFLKVVPEYSLDDCPPIDIIVLPGGGTNSVTSNTEFLNRLQAKIGDAEIALSVCTGAFILGYLGHLDGLEVTTWHGAIGRLKAQHHQAKVRNDRRFIDNGKIVTSAGVSAGIDSSLHLVARLCGKPTAVATARYMEYAWQYADLESETPASNAQPTRPDDQ